ncbi:MAG: hypothetical protein Q8M26_14360 [Pseudolabrys sp.]|nr:hypothetical protein [Pseudolabrys sp.]
MKKTTKIWVGLGAFVIAGSGTAMAASATEAAVLETTAPASAKHGLMSSAANIILAQAQGGEGEGGGEGGVDVAAADKDPVQYNIALQVIAAHYYAGFAAYEAKEMEAGAQMFAHGLGEVYIEMEDVFKRRGVTTLGKALQDAVDAAAANKPVAEVRKLYQAVLNELKAAEGQGPASSQPAAAVKAQVVVDMLNRAAAQFAASQNDKTLEPYLDGLGFAVAADKESAAVLPTLRKADKKKADALKAAIDMAKAVYPGIKRPAKAKVTPAQFLAAASAAQLAVSNW